MRGAAWSVPVVAVAATAIVSVTLTFTYRRANQDPYAGLTFAIYNIAPSANTTAWGTPVISTAGGTATITNSGNIPAGQLITIHTDFSGNDNSTGDVRVDAAITYAGGSISTAQIPLTSVVQATGSDEPFPHDEH